MGGAVGKAAPLALTKDEAKAFAQARDIVWDDVVEEAFLRVARKGGQLRDKVPRKELARALDELESLGLQHDEDGAEGTGTGSSPAIVRAVPRGKCPFSVPLAVRDGTHQVSKPTKDLLKSIGGRDALLRITSRFYPMMFKDQQLSKFVTDQTEPHPQRLADWIAEKMSGVEYWSSQLHLREQHHAYDRSSAHYKAWNSPHREASRRGEHFKWDDAVMWMRLMFLATRQEGLDTIEIPKEENKKKTKKSERSSGGGGAAADKEDAAGETVVVESPFFTWFVQFIAHFVRVYERRAVPYAREAAEWSLDPTNVIKYEKDGFLMRDIAGRR